MAAAALHGVDAWRLATTGDPIEVVLLTAVTQRAVELGAERDEALARRIVNDLVAAWNRGKKR